MSTLQNDTVIIGQDVFTSSASATHKVGQLATDGNGRYFRYVLNGATAVVPGKLYQASAEDTTNLQNLTITNVAVGATSITTTSTTTIAANATAGGFITVTDGTTGKGLTYRLKGNTVASSAAVTFYLEDPIITATTGTAKVDVIKSPYSGIVVNPATATSAPIGVGVYPIAANEYGWVQVKGAASVLADGAITVGTNLVASNAVAGAVEPATGVQAVVGTAITGIATTEYGFVQLNLS